MPTGTEVSTVRLWEFVDAHPNLTTEEIVAAATREGFFPGGYALRAYAARLTRSRRDRSRVGRPTLERSEVHPRDVDRDKAMRHVTVAKLGEMRRWGSLRQEDGRWFTARPLHRTGIGAMVVSMDEVRADVALRNLRIMVGRYIEQLEAGTTYFPVPLREQLVSWYRLSREEYFEQQFGSRSEEQA